MKRRVFGLVSIGIVVSISASAANHFSVGQPNGFKRAANVTSLVHRDEQGHIAELSLTNGASWVTTDLTQVGNAVAASGDPTEFKRSDGVVAVYYRSNGNIHELSRTGGSPAWADGDVQGLSGSSITAVGDPTAFVRHDNVNSVVYRGANNHLIELALAIGGAWGNTDLNAFLAARGVAVPSASGDPFGFKRSDNVDSIVFRAGSKIHEVALSGSNWQSGQVSDTAAIAAAGDPFGYVRTDGISAVVYRGIDNHVHELRLQSGTWRSADLFVAANALPSEPAAVGNPAAFVRGDGVSSVVYRGADNHIHELALGGSWAAGDPWQIATANGDSPALANGDPYGVVRADGTTAIVYSGVDKHIWELRIANGTWQAGDVSTAADVAPQITTFTARGFQTQTYALAINATGFRPSTSIKFFYDNPVNGAIALVNVSTKSDGSIALVQTGLDAAPCFSLKLQNSSDFFPQKIRAVAPDGETALFTTNTLADACL
jgi:hypothetical protein